MTDVLREPMGNVVLLHPAMRSRRAVQSGKPEPRPSDPPVGVAGRDRVEMALAQAAAIRAMRDARDTVMPFRLFGEPAWELIIELFLGAHASQPMSVAALCNACSCPERIAAGHLGKLIDAGLAVASVGWADDEEATAALSPHGYRTAVDIFNVAALRR